MRGLVGVIHVTVEKHVLTTLVAPDKSIRQIMQGSLYHRFAGGKYVTLLDGQTVGHRWPASVTNVGPPVIEPSTFNFKITCFKVHVHLKLTDICTWGLKNNKIFSHYFVSCLQELKKPTKQRWLATKIPRIFMFISGIL